MPAAAQLRATVTFCIANILTNLQQPSTVNNITTTVSVLNSNLSAYSGVPFRGLQCSNPGGNQTSNERYWKAKKVLLFAKFMKSYTFLSVCI